MTLLFLARKKLLQLLFLPGRSIELSIETINEQRVVSSIHSCETPVNHRLPYIFIFQHLYVVQWKTRWSALTAENARWRYERRFSIRNWWPAPQLRHLSTWISAHYNILSRRSQSLNIRTTNLDPLYITSWFPSCQNNKAHKLFRNLLTVPRNIFPTFSIRIAAARYYGKAWLGSHFSCAEKSRCRSARCWT